ncbi:hypothetical protein BC826DRAFT_1105141 [Russula brevipes]|nr:hypothetical protein BC826DRAFT_1105141 [Russula brevipes]
MFRSFALFGGLALLSSAAAHQGHHEVYKVQVSDSAGALVFEPPYIVSKHSVAFDHTVPLTASLIQYAAKGDTVEFTFASNNHTATESESIYDPCTPKYGGIDSGLYPACPKGASGDYLPVWNLTLTSDDPVWMHCRQAANTPASHCGQGMVFAINPEYGSFEKFQKNALAVGAKLKYAPVYPSYARAKRELQ